MNNDPDSTGLFDKRITLGNVISLVVVIGAIVTATWAVSGFTNGILGRLDNVETKVDRIAMDLKAWHRTEHAELQ